MWETSGASCIFGIKTEIKSFRLFFNPFSFCYSISCFPQCKLSLAYEEIANGEIWKVSRESIFQGNPVPGATAGDN